MLKYTLGALAAAVILIGAAFVVLTQVTDGGADQGPAPSVIISVNEEIVWPEDIYLKAGEITDLSLQNHSSVPRAIHLDGDGVEQLPELHPTDGQLSRESADSVRITAGPAMASSKLMRINKPGEYTLYVVIPGVYFPGLPVRVIVE